MRYGCIRSGAQGCETLVNLSPWGSIFQRKTISTCYVFIFYNLNKNVSESKYSRHLESKRNSEIVKLLFFFVELFQRCVKFNCHLLLSKSCTFFFVISGTEMGYGFGGSSGLKRLPDQMVDRVN